MFSKIKLIIKMIGWFFVEIFELITGKRKFMQEYDPEEDQEILDDADSEEKVR